MTMINLANKFDRGILYPPGQSYSSVKLVQIHVATGSAAIEADGHREHIDLGWDARPAPDGEHEISSPWPRGECTSA